MQKLFITLWIMLLLALLLNACFKNKEIKIDQESKAYCLFDQGSYWIYQDSATLAVDSIVMNKDIGYSNIPKNTFVPETYYTLVVSYSQDTIFNSHFRLTTDYADFGTKVATALEKNDCEFCYHSGETADFYYPNTRNKLTLLTKKNNYSVNGIKYDEIKIFEYNIKAEIYYWAKHIGLIRVERYGEKDNLISVKNLIRYNAKPYKK